MERFSQEKYIEANLSVTNIYVAYKDTTRKQVWNHDGGYKTSCSLYFTEQGNHSVYMNGEKYDVKAGDIVFQNKNIFYKSTGKHYLTHYGIAFNIHKNSSTDILDTVMSVKKPEKYKVLFEEAAILYDTKPPLYKLRIKVLIYEIICMLATEQLNHETGRKHPLIEKSITYMNANLYNSSLLLSEVAKQSDISFNHFRKLFKEQYGITPIEYVTNERLTKAKKLLIHSPMTIDEIAKSCGFNSSVYFYRIFKKNTGVTPSDYRKTNL